MKKFSYDDKLYLPENERTGRTQLHENGFARRHLFTLRREVIMVCFTWPQEEPRTNKTSKSENWGGGGGGGEELDGPLRKDLKTVRNGYI